jgi:hypothetical protein
MYGVTRSDGGPERPCTQCGLSFRHRRTRIKFCSRECFHLWVAEQNRTEGGKRQVMKTGYIRLTLPGGRRVAEHRWVWEQANGPIPPGGLIHHLNGNKTDNRLENLKLVIGHKEHAEEHGGSLRDAYPARTMAKCHPDQPNRGLGFCLRCYMKNRRGTLNR